MFDVGKIREDFPILGRKIYDGKPLIYLDNAATAQKPARVIERIDWLYRNLNANIHRGVHYLSIESTEEYEAARETVRKFINAADRTEIVFTAGATAAINTVAYSFGERYFSPGDNMIISGAEHHSNLVPWQIACERKGVEMRVIPVADDGAVETDKLTGLIDGRTRIVAITQASNVLGTRPDIKKVIDTAHAAGVPVLVDGCQGIVHGGADVQALDCDFYAFSAHKLYGPTGVGVLYGKRKWLEEMPPFMSGGDMVDTVTFEKTTYAALPLKFEAGTANYIGAIGMAEAMRYLSELDMKAAAAHEERLAAFTSEELSKIDGLKIYGTTADKCPIVSFTVDGIHPTDIGMILDKMGIAVRTGHHCAEPVMARFGVTGMCRASFGLYNTGDEAEALVRGIKRAVKMLKR